MGYGAALWRQTTKLLRGKKEWLVEWGVYALSASKAIFRARTYNCNLFSPVMMMNETRRKPTTGRQSPSLFDKWHGIFYMPSRIDEAGHTKAFDYPVAEHWGESQRAKRSLVGFEPTSAHTYESEIQRSTTYATPTKSKTQRILLLWGSEIRNLRNTLHLGTNSSK